MSGEEDTPSGIGEGNPGNYAINRRNLMKTTSGTLVGATLFSQTTSANRQTIQAGETITGTIESSDDSDTYELPVDQGDVIEVDFQKESRALTEFDAQTDRTDIELGGFDSEGVEQFTGRGTIKETGSLFISVFTRDGETTGQDYEFTITVEEGKDQWPAPDRAEIQAGETVTGTVHTSDDADTFELLVDKGDVIEVNFQKESRALTAFDAQTDRTDIELGGFDSEGTEQFTGRGTIKETGTLYISVFTRDGETTGQDYEFTVNVDRGADKWPAPDRAEIQTGETIAGTVHTSDDADTFELLVDQGDVIDVTFEKESRALTAFDAQTDRTDIELGGFDSKGTERFTASRTIEETGTLYISVFTRDGETLGQDYRFVINGELADEVSAGFTATLDAPTVGEEVTFDASETTANTTIDSYSWEFGDGTTATGEVVTHTYETTGEYTVALTAATDNSSDTATATLTVGSGEHESGVSQDVWDAVTSQNDPSGELTFQDLIDAIEGFQRDGTVGGVSISFQDLIDLIEWYQGV